MNAALMLTKIRQMVRSFGLPRIIIALFFVFIVYFGSVLQCKRGNKSFRYLEPLRHECGAGIGDGSDDS